MSERRFKPATQLSIPIFISCFILLAGLVFARKMWWAKEGNEMWHWMRKAAFVLVAVATVALLLPFSPPTPAASAATTVASDDGWGWQNPQLQGNDLNGVWGSSSDNVFAVGDYGTILHFASGSWTSMDSGTAEDLNGVWGSSSDNVFAVGDGGTVLNYDGNSWFAVDTGTATLVNRNAVWGSSSDNIFVVGDSGSILHYDGSWTSLNSATAEDLRSVWGTSSTNVYAVGDHGVIRHYDGSGADWAIIANPSPNPENLRGVWGSSSNDVYVVGDAISLHYDGSWSWQVETLHTLHGVWGLSSSDVYLVGYSEAAGGIPVIDHWNGTSWTYPYQMYEAVSLSSVWGSSESDVFVVGTSGTILHYGGGDWALMESGTTDEISDVWGTGPDDVFAAAYGGGNGRVLHYDGSYWNTMTTVSGGGLFGIWGTSPSDVFAVGTSGLIMHYNGSFWSAMSSPTSSMLNAVWCDSATDNVFAVGESGTIVHYDGSSWSTMAWSGGGPVSPANCVLNGVWGTSATNVYAAGYYGTYPTFWPLVLHYDGADWTFTVAFELSGTLHGIWGSSASDIYAVGSNVIYHFNGSIWSQAYYYPFHSLYGVWGSSSTDVYAVGVDLEGGQRSLVLHCDGSPPYPWAHWTPITVPSTANLNGVWGSSATDVFAVGAGGTILHTGGWTTMAGGSSTEATYSLWGSSASDVFAVCSGGDTSHFDGSAWTVTDSQDSPLGSFNAVWGSSASDVFAINNQGAILHYGGTSWDWMSSGSTQSLRGIWGSSASNVFAVGDSGTILNYDGDSWDSMTSGTSEGLKSVWGSSSDNVFVVGDYGTILHYDGDSWDSMNSYTTEDLSGVWGTSSSNVYAVGDRGTIRHYDGNGADWSTVVNPSPNLENLRGVWGSSSDNVYVVGDAISLQYDGDWSWQVETLSTLYSVWGYPSSDVYAVGCSGFTGPQTPLIGQYSGSSWEWFTYLESQGRYGQGGNLYGVWGSSASDVYAVGCVGDGFNARPVIFHYGGAGEFETVYGGTGALNDVWGSSASYVLAVGNGGQIFRFDGSQWQSSGALSQSKLMTSTAPAGFAPSAGITTESLYGVWGTSASDIFAVGADGTIVHYDGSAWSTMVSGTTEDLYDIWGSAHADVFAVGTNGTIRHFDGSTWGTMSSGTGNALRGVWGSSTSNVFAVGDGGIICHYNGSTWGPMTSPTANRLFCIWGSSPSDVYAVGADGTIIHYNGNAWSLLESGTGHNLYGVWGSSGSDVFVAGQGGAIVHYPEGTQAAPQVASVNPGQGDKGQILSVTVAGANFAGATTLTMGAGTTVNSFTVDSQTQISASITIDAAADSGGRAVSVTGPGGTGTKANGFMISDSTPPTTPMVTDDGIYTASATQLHASWTSSDPESDVSEYQYAIGTASGGTDVIDWTSTGTATEVTKTGLNLTTGTTYYFGVKAKNGTDVWSSVGVSDGIVVDATPPATPTVADDGESTASATQLHALWTSSDAESGVAEYQYALGTTSGATDVVGWTSAGTMTEVTQTGLSLTRGSTYYFAVKAKNGAGTWSEVGASNGIAFPYEPPDRPGNASPAAGDAKVSLAPTLESSAFSDPDPGATHTASQWQITTAAGDYSDLVFDSGTDTVNLTSITIPAEVLKVSTEYYWRVRHQDSHGEWSDWSNETAFATVSGSQAKSGLPLWTWIVIGLGAVAILAGGIGMVARGARSGRSSA